MNRPFIFKNSDNKGEDTMKIHSNNHNQDGQNFFRDHYVPTPSDDDDISPEEGLHIMLDELKRVEEGNLTPEESYRNEYISRVTPRDILGEVHDLRYLFDDDDGGLIGVKFDSYSAMGRYSINTLTGVIAGLADNIADTLSDSLCRSITNSILRDFPPCAFCADRDTCNHAR